MAQWLGLHAPNAGGVGLIPGRGSSACCVARPKKRKKEKENMKNEIVSA